MAVNPVPASLLTAANLARRSQEAELARAAITQAVRVTNQVTTGSGDIDASFWLDGPFRLVFVRCHFAGGAGMAPVQISLDAAQGTAYDTVLYTVKVAGAGADLNFRLTAAETQLPSAWAAQNGDKFRIRWTNPDPGNTTWGLEVGLAPA
ncbi:MAG: hypothetical protein ACE5GE_01870 [Phycisphaerae bacterium]